MQPNKIKQKKIDKVRKINTKLKSFQSTLPGTQMGVFARDEQQIKMGDMGKAKQNRMKWVLRLTLQPLSIGFNEGGQSVCNGPDVPLYTLMSNMDAV